MADSPGKLLSRICLGGESDRPPKYGGCVNVFLHLFDWNRRLSKRGLLNKKLLPAERRPQRQQSGRKKKQQQQQQQKMNEDRLPMAKLLLIADENRQFAIKNSAAAGRIGEQQQPAPKNTPGAIARLMGLEHMPQAESPQANAASAATTEMRSLQELLHLDQEPKMLQEFLSGKQEQQQQQNKEQVPSQRDALLSLLIQEVMHAKNTPQKQQQQQPRGRRRRAQHSRSKGNFLSRQIFGSSSGECAPANAKSSTCLAVATAGCAGFSKKKPALFLEAAAATMLEPRSSRAVATAEITTTSACAKMLEEELEEEEEDLFARRAKRRVMSAPCSPTSNRTLSSSTSIRSLMELFLDDLEAELQHESSSTFRHAVSEPCSPIRQSGFEAVPASAECIAIQESHERAAAAAAAAAERPVAVDDLGAHDYISFRDFLTGAKSLKEAAAAPSSSSGSSPASSELLSTSPNAKLQAEDDDVPEDCCCQRQDEISSTSSGHERTTRYMLRVVHNPLFEDYTTSSDNASSAAGSLFSSEFESEEDQGLEEILKSILWQTTSDAKERGLIDTSRLTWFPDASSSLASSAHNNYLYNKDSSEADESPRSKGMLDQADDSLEVTSSESNCGEDGGQPSPVSVLDSPFDDELSRKGKAASSIHRKRLDFDEPTSTSKGGTGSSSFLARLQCFDPDTLEEAADYMSMVLEQSGLFHQTEVLLLLPELSSSTYGGGGGGIISSSVFERLEDRMRVQQLIQHLEHCGSSSERSSKNLESLRAHYQSYHECRSRRRMVFDFMNETLSSIMSPFGDEAWTRPRVTVELPSGRELVDEVHTKVSQWRRKQFGSTQELVEDDMNSSSSCKEWRGFRTEVSELGLCCERDIFNAMMEELANDLLALQTTGLN